ncbi:hypothetical protein BV25DRAFT_1891455 [Artomyces pyxidatus]|uniref:Uncharacterized protein n=1 Tax=Artomyces pyxidatus TaxID=48021 RepID=A0ACB8SQ64_9AGAM|nr:hypothetical protein BV25DRAFT_1891455 [Artomyces pyxidatus]
MLLRYGGQVVEGESEIVVADPRKAEGFKRPIPQRPPRSELYETHYEYDANSAGPAPPTAVLVTNISPLTPSQQIRRHFSVHGTVVAFEPQIDKATGGALGIVFIKYSSHAEAQRCVEKEHRNKLGLGMVSSINNGEGQEMKVVFDGERKTLVAVMRELDDRRRRQERAVKAQKEREEKRADNTVRATPASSSGTPLPAALSSWRPPHPAHLPFAPHLRPSSGTPSSPTVSSLPAPGPNLPPKPATPSNTQMNSFPGAGPLQPMAPRVRRPPQTLVRARLSVTQPATARVLPMAESASSSSTPLPPRGRFHSTRIVDHYSPMQISRSPSPVSRKPGQSSRSAQQRQREIVVEELSKNGFDHVRIDGQGGILGGAVSEEDVKQFLRGFQFDKILRDHVAWYVTFPAAGTARRAAMVLGTRTLANHTVSVSIHPPPTASSAAPVKSTWTDDELIQQATELITKELKQLLEKDVRDQLVGVRFKRLVADHRKGDNSGAPSFEIRGLKGLSFKKANKRAREVVKPVAPEVPEMGVEVPAEEKAVDDEEVVARPKKKRKKEHVKVVLEDIESEDDVVEDRKRATSVVVEEPAVEEPLVEEPVMKKVKLDVAEDGVEEVVPTKKGVAKKSKKGAHAVKTVEEEPVDQFVVPEDLDFDIPAVTHLHVTPDLASPPSSPAHTPQRPPLSPVHKLHRPPPGISPAPDPFEEGICEDDEDMFYARLALAEAAGLDIHSLLPSPAPAPDSDAPPPFRVHVTGSARTEGYYKISHAEKSAYVAQYASRSTAADTVEEKPAQQPKQTMTSSRSNRANARRQAQGLEEINQVQRAMALSKGETAAAELSIKFNQLQTRKKHLRFARSPIHDWGLYAMERISRGEMVIEYVGEVIRAQVADKREKAYERQGIGSSYLFRIDEDLVVDATKKGNLGRLINHSCDPNCTAKIITINGEKKIVIYAKQDIELGDEITYDYHFPIEQDKIPCLCGSAKCRGYLN